MRSFFLLIIIILFYFRFIDTGEFFYPEKIDIETKEQHKTHHKYNKFPHFIRSL
ncbi:MAG: hypothetical protein RL023_854 [Candidatus Parcubacteria bacterium]